MFSSRSSLRHLLTRRSCPSTPHRSAYTTTPRRLATQTQTGRVISETAKAENGPTKGSTSAQVQSQVGKAQNFYQAAQEIGQKMQANPGAVTSEDAAHLKSREARATAQAQPPADSMSAEAQRLASANEGATRSTSGPANPAQQSEADRMSNLESVVADLADKVTNHPEQITSQEANMLHSREVRAFGVAEKGGIAAQAQSAASRNEQK